MEIQDYTELEFQPIDIPHDWLIYDMLNLYEDSIGWYRKRFTYNKGEADQVLLYFEGVYMDSFVYVNRIFVGEWKYGYSSFEHEITGALVDGENEVVVKVIYKSPNSRWYTGAGIYHNVWLKKRSRNHITTDGIYVSIIQEDARWRVEINTELSLCQEAQLTHTILRSKQPIATSVSRIIMGDEGSKMSKVGEVCDKQVLYVNDPLLWSTDESNLYQLETRLELILTDENKGILEEIETVVQNIGFRTINMDPENGFILNGEKMKLNGVCEHHDLGALGAAFNKTALRRRFALLKEMGVNALRTAHNMPAPELMDLADQMGLLIVSEAFDVWERPKTGSDYARFFKEWAHADVRSWVMRDRNHPSLIMWSIGNEIYDTHADQKGQEITRMLANCVRRYDPKGNAKVTIASNYMPWENA